jgi:hypothetical protein
LSAPGLNGELQNTGKSELCRLAGIARRCQTVAATIIAGAVGLSLIYAQRFLE